MIIVNSLGNKAFNLDKIKIIFIDDMEYTINAVTDMGDVEGVGELGKYRNYTECKEAFEKLMYRIYHQRTVVYMPERKR